MITFSPKQKQLINFPFDVTLEVSEGTPRSSKTTAGVFRFAKQVIRSRDENHLVGGYNQEQAYRLFMECDGFGLIHIFGDYGKIKHNEDGDHLEVHTPNGIKRIFYKGGGKADSKKAITGMSLGSVAFCEIDLLHMDFIQECFRRTYASKDRYHLADLNPPAPNHPIIKEVFEVQKTRWTHWRIDDNPIISEKRKKEIHDTLIKNPYLFKRDWLGERVIPTGVIYSMFDMAKNIKQKMTGEKIELYFSADGGQSDATSCSCNIITKHKDKPFNFRLNRVAHYYHSGKDTGQVKAMSVYAREIKDFIMWCQEKYDMHRSDVYVDPACKSLREELHLLGINTSPADNNRIDAKKKGGGIEVGIERMQNAMENEQFVLIEQANSKYDHYHFIKEIGMYCRDDNGKPIDDFNHAMDCARYSTNHFYRDYVL